MLLAAASFFCPYMMHALFSLGVTFHSRWQSSLYLVKFQTLASNMSLIPSEHIGKTISVHAYETEEYVQS